MGWTAIILAVLQIFGPFLKDLLKKWLDRKLTEAAGHLPEMAFYGSEDAARNALFDQAVVLQRGPVRRSLLRRLKAMSMDCGITTAGAARPLDSEFIVELQDFADAAEQHE